MRPRKQLRTAMLLRGGLFLAMACGDSPAELDDGTAAMPIALDVGNEDGFVDVNVFESSADHFSVGDGGDQSPLALVYEVAVTNELAEPVFGLVVGSEISPNTGHVICREVLDDSPNGSANPTSGTVVGGDCAPDGLLWNLGTLDGGETAILYFRGEALQEGDDVHRVSVSADGLSDLRVEEPTQVGGSGPPLSVDMADGFIDSDVFDSSISVHSVGDGGSSAPEALVYLIVVVNQGVFSATGVQVSARIPRSRPGSGLICREILETAPDGGENPNLGSASCTATGVTWTLGTIDGREAALLFVRVEALTPGNHVTRVTFSADQLSREVVRDELTPVVAAPEP